MKDLTEILLQKDNFTRAAPGVALATAGERLYLRNFDAPCDKRQGHRALYLRFAKSYKQPPAIVATGNTRHHPFEIDHFIWSEIRPTVISGVNEDARV